MRIGVAAENRPLEKRVILHPEELKPIAHRHEVLVESGAGLGVGILDAQYTVAGCRVASREKVYGADLVLRIKEPLPEEVRLLKPGAILMSMMHLRCAPVLERGLIRQKVIAVPLENIKDALGRRMVEAVQETGRIGMEYGFKLWGKDPAKAKVKIMGYGNVAQGAIRAAMEKYASVEILNRRHFPRMDRHLPGTDILVDAVNRPFRRDVLKETPFINAAMLNLLKPGSVLVDLVANPEGHAPIETMRPTYMNEPYYVINGIYHTALWGWPGMDPVNISKRYSLQLAPLVRAIADHGLEKAPVPVRDAVIRLDAGERVT
jgi:alanine dehydrogenase